MKIAPNIFTVGLTGGIASGKSTVSAAFFKLGVPIIDSDVIARNITAVGTPALEAISAAFGTRILSADGSLDRPTLRALIFDDQAARATLEAITHPIIRLEMQTQAFEAGGPYQIHVIPLLAEGITRANLSQILVVDCLKSLQIKRTMQRDKTTEAAARAIIASQAPRASRLAIADQIIVNNEGKTKLHAQVLALHQGYLIAAAH